MEQQSLPSSRQHSSRCSEAIRFETVAICVKGTPLQCSGTREFRESFYRDIEKGKAGEFTKRDT
jgi:hypothetical protein